MARLLRAELYLHLGRDDAAWSELRQLDGLGEPACETVVHTLMGTPHLKAGDNDSAMRDLGEALDWDDEHAPAHLLRRRIWEARGDTGAAPKAYTRAVKLDPEDPDIRMARAEARLSLGRASRALEDVEALRKFVAQGFEGASVVDSLNDLERRVRAAL